MHPGIWLVVFLLLLPVLNQTTILAGHLPGTNDAQLHLQRFVAAALNWREGILWPRWSPNLFFGYGYPIGNFYAPGIHIIGGFFIALGASAVHVWLAVELAGLILYAVGGYLFGRSLGGELGGLLGAALSLYAPFRFYELLEEGNLSQFIAMALMPWVLWAVGRCVRLPTLRRMALAACSVASLVVTHHPTAALFLPFAVGYMLMAVVAASPDEGITRLRRFAFGVGIFMTGMLLSVVYWLPALLEARNVQLDSAAGQYPIAAGMVPLRELLGRNWSIPPDAFNPARAFAVGQPGLIFALIGLVAALWPRSPLSRWQRVHAIGAVGAGTLALFLVTPQAYGLWQTLPLSKLILYPWRFLGVASLAVIPAAVIALAAIPRSMRSIALFVAVIGIIGAAIPAMKPIAADSVTETTITPGTSVRYEITSGNLGAVSTNEYTPKWVLERPRNGPNAAFYDDWHWNIEADQKTLPPDAALTQSDGPHRTGTQFAISVPQPFTLTLHQFFYPGWQALLDGQDVAIGIHPTEGTMQIAVPEGNHTLEVWYTGTSIQHIAETISVFTFGLCVVLLVLTPVLRGTLHSELTASYRVLSGALAAVLVTAAALFPMLYRTFEPSSAPTIEIPLSVQFVNQHHEALFDLIGVGYEPQENVAAGDWLTLRLYWRALTPSRGGWRIAVKLLDQKEQIAWASSDTDAPGGFNTSDWPPDKFIIDKRVLQVKPDALPYSAHLSITIYQPNGETLTQIAPLALPSFHIQRNLCPAAPASAIQFGNALTLLDARLNRADNNAVSSLTLTWRVDAPTLPDLTLFLHYQTGSSVLGTGDRLPIEEYPSSQWQAGQCLTQTYPLALPDGTRQIFIGYYEPKSGARLPARGSPNSIENDGVKVELNP